MKRLVDLTTENEEIVALFQNRVLSEEEVKIFVSLRSEEEFDYRIIRDSTNEGLSLVNDEWVIHRRLYNKCWECDVPIWTFTKHGKKLYSVEEYIRVGKRFITPSQQLDGEERELFEAFRGRPKAFLDTQIQAIKDGTMRRYSAGMVFIAIACDAIGDDRKDWNSFFTTYTSNYSPARNLFKTEEELIDYLKNMHYEGCISDLMSSKLNLSRKLCKNFLRNNHPFLDMDDKSQWDKCLTYIEAGEFEKIVTTRGFLQEINGLNISAGHIRENPRLDLLSKIVEMGNNLDFSRVPEREFRFEDLVTMGITHNQIRSYFHENIFEGMSSREFNRFIQSLSGRTLDCMAQGNLESILDLLQKFIEKELVDVIL